MNNEVTSITGGSALSEKMKRVYEAMFLVDSAVASTSWDDVMAAIQRVLDRAQAEVVQMSKWDERRLAYEVAGRKRGTYILCYFRVDPTMIRSIERDVQLDETILRVLILKAEHLTEEQMQSPTPAMRRETSGSGSSEEDEFGGGRRFDDDDDRDDSVRERPKKERPVFAEVSLEDEEEVEVEDEDVIEAEEDDEDINP